MNPDKAAGDATETAYVFDARGIDRRFRHPAIFAAVDSLTPGEVMRFVNDHEPLPLLGQLGEIFGEALRADYRQREQGAVVIDFRRVE